MGDRGQGATNAVLSWHAIRAVVEARSAGRRTAPISLDLGCTQATGTLSDGGVEVGSDVVLSWAQVAQIQDDPSACFLATDDGLEKIYRFSPEFNRPYSLFPTAGAPTLINSGFTMHRIVGIDPYEDTRRKIRAASPIRGTVLDTTTGLGYTAIEAARTASRVVTIELDPTVLEVARLNPWSQPLFTSRNIEQLVGDSFDIINEFDDDQFTLIIHDPPSFSLAGDLYSGEFYRRAHRVLAVRGRMFHYIGNLDSRQGSRVVQGVIRRLTAAGFERVVKRGEAFGVVAYKG